MISNLRRFACYLAGAALATMLTTAAHAAVVFDAGDCGDSDTIAELNSACGHFENTVYTIDVLFDATDTTGGEAARIWGLNFHVTDRDEVSIHPSSWAFAFSGAVSVDSFATGSLNNATIRYRPVVDLIHGELIGTLSFTTLAPLVNDGQADVTMEGWGNGGGRFFAPNVLLGAFEVQPALVPLPAPALLMLGGMAAFAGIRRKRRA